MSISSVTPSPSVSFCESEHPLASTTSPVGVEGQLSRSSVTPSPSVSSWEVAQPSEFTVAPEGVSEQLSNASVTPSLSVSINSNSAVILAFEFIVKL